MLKPIQQDIDLAKRKLETILEACVDPGSPLNELEKFAGAIFEVIGTELTH